MKVNGSSPQSSRQQQCFSVNRRSQVLGKWTGLQESLTSKILIKWRKRSVPYPNQRKFLLFRNKEDIPGGVQSLVVGFSFFFDNFLLKFITKVAQIPPLSSIPFLQFVSRAFFLDHCTEEVTVQSPFLKVTTCFPPRRCSSVANLCHLAMLQQVLCQSSVVFVRRCMMFDDFPSWCFTDSKALLFCIPFSCLISLLPLLCSKPFTWFSSGFKMLPFCLDSHLQL